tara:strand:- start:9263 stop:9952 length:690 start_codon:yes stop_codon:yes gene_type:complete
MWLLKTKQSKEIIMEIFKKHVEKFLKKAEPINSESWKNWNIPNVTHGGYPRNSIFFSEALVLYSLANEYNIDCFIESGVFRGGSTALWCKTFNDKKLFSVDYVREGNNPREKWNNVRNKLTPLYKNITFIEGNGNEILPKIISENSDKRFGVFVDGPKDSQGLSLMEKCFSFENVYFSSLHDYTHETYFSTRNNVEFNKQFGYLNEYHAQTNQYPFGPGLTVIDKNKLI